VLKNNIMYFNRFSKLGHTVVYTNKIVQPAQNFLFRALIQVSEIEYN